MPASLLRWFPFLQWSRPTPATLGRDAWAGASVGLVLVPQAIAYATLAGMPAETGLYAAMLPAIVGALWGSAPLLAVGPVALTSLLTFGSLAPLAAPGSTQWVTLAVWLALYAGFVQLMLGVCRFGRIADLVSQPVVAGFINAAALIIIGSQLPDLLGLRGVTWQQWPAALSRSVVDVGTGPSSAVFGLGAVAALVVFKRMFPRWPGMLIVGVAGIVVSAGTGYEQRGGDVVGALAAGLPALALPPTLSLDQHRMLWPAAFILALVSFAEAMSSCRTLARKQQQPWDENQELVGQGLAKIASGLCGAFPVSGSFSRSALNLYAGAVSGWSSLFSTVCVLVTALFLVEWIYHLPSAVLAAMIIVPTVNLLEPSAFSRLLRISRDDALVMATTFVVTLLSLPYIHWGVFAGIATAMAAFLYRRSHPRIIEVSLHDDGTLRDRERFALPALAPGLLAVRIDGALNFLTAAPLERFVAARCTQSGAIKCVLLCASGMNDIDASGVETLQAIQRTLQDKGIVLYLSAVKKQVSDVLERAGMLAPGAPPLTLYPTDRDAVGALAVPVQAPAAPAMA